MAGFVFLPRRIVGEGMSLGVTDLTRRRCLRHVFGFSGPRVLGSTDLDLIPNSGLSQHGAGDGAGVHRDVIPTIGGIWAGGWYEDVAMSTLRGPLNIASRYHPTPRFLADARNDRLCSSGIYESGANLESPLNSGRTDFASIIHCLFPRTRGPTCTSRPTPDTPDAHPIERFERLLDRVSITRDQ